MIAISENHYKPPLASGSHADLTKLIYDKRQSGLWRYPIAIINTGTKVISDQSYYDSLGKSDGPSLDERLKIVQEAIKQGYTSLREIEKVTGLSRGQIRYIDKVYHPRANDYWLAEPYEDGSPIEADSARTLSEIIGLPVSTIRQVARNGGMALGYKIKKVVSK